jgi:hypothetical protein
MVAETMAFLLQGVKHELQHTLHKLCCSPSTNGMLEILQLFLFQAIWLHNSERIQASKKDVTEYLS